MSKKPINRPPKTIGANGVDMGERGVYDKRNKLNELTGKEWIFFTNTVWITGYSPTATENIGLKHRKIHPSPKPPGLIRDIVNFFTKSEARILDPFVGVGGTLLGVAMAGGNRTAVGVDLEVKYRDAYINACRDEKLPEMQYLIGDSIEILKSKKIKDESFDLVIADPPYSNMMSVKRTGQKTKLYDDVGATPYTALESDLGNMEKDDFFNSLKEIIILSLKKLKKDKYLVLFCKDFQPKGKDTGLLHAEIINKLNEIENVEYRGMRIWHDQAMSLYPFGYPFSFVMNQIHQYVLIFRKTK